jgi:site-specific DNA recombinase
LFARLAYCADCGKGMNYKNDREGYVCSTYQKRGSKACASHFVRHEELKEIVLADLSQLSCNALDRNSLVESTLKKANVKTTRAKIELQKIQKLLQQLQQEQLVLVRKLTSEAIDDESFKMGNASLKLEQNTLMARIKELETIVSREQENEVFMRQFQEEIKRFVELDIADEEVLRAVLQRLIERIEIEADGDINIHYNFRNPLS